MNAQKILLRKFRSQYNLTWLGVAKTLGVALPTVEAWHSGRNPMPFMGRGILKLLLADPAMATWFRELQAEEKEY